MNSPIHTSDDRHFRHLWLSLGGWIEPIRRTGEMRYGHDSLAHAIRVNGRRHDVPAVLLTKLNQLIRLVTVDNPKWHSRMEKEPTCSAR